MSFLKLMWICGGIGTLIVGSASGVSLLLLVVLIIIAAVPTARLITSDAEPTAGLPAVSVLAACVAIGSFIPIASAIGFVGYVALTWHSTLSS